MITIGITGTLGAGKGTIVDYLIQKKGFVHYSVRAFLIEEIERRGMPVNRDSMTLVGNDLRAQHSPSWIVEQLYAQAQTSGKNCIIESIRTPGEVEALRNKPNFYLFAVDADPALVKYAAAHSDGLVIAGAGAGEFSQAWRSALERCKVPVVVSSRTGCGPVLQETMVCPNAVAAGTLQPAKAAVLLRLALTRTRDTEELIRIFDTY